MQCENVFCIYWKDNVCALKDIQLDIGGSCVSCIYVDIEEKTLSSLRMNKTKELEKCE